MISFDLDKIIRNIDIVVLWLKIKILDIRMNITVYGRVILDHICVTTRRSKPG